MTNPLQKALADTGSENFINDTAERFLVRELSIDMPTDSLEVTPERLLRLGYIYEREGLKIYKEWLRNGAKRIKEQENGNNVNENSIIYSRDVAPLFYKSFSCWRSLLNIEGKKEVIEGLALDMIDNELNQNKISPYHILAFHLTLTGTLALRLAEIRLELKKFSFVEIFEYSWRENVLSNIIESLILLSRKANGWEDIDNALRRIASLRELQIENEDNYIKSIENKNEQVQAAVELVGIYHLAQIICLTGEYLLSGAPGITSINNQLDRHHSQTVKAFNSINNHSMIHYANLIWAGCRETAHNSIWTHSTNLPPRVKEFVQVLTDRGRPNPILELWPAQQEAFLRNLLTTYHRAILVEMPTSAGKTLLAKFVIVQTKTLNPEGTIAYIVPTRALVNQITYELRSDFQLLNPSLRVEMTVPAFELDPTEDVLLKKAPDILVTTPEKLDLLVRKNHISVSNLSLIVADEAHNIREKGRGPRLELLLGTLKRDRPEARFLLLSPFLPNDTELLNWLGEGRELPPISVDWKPGNRIVGGFEIIGRKPNRRLVFKTLPSLDNSDIKENRTIYLSCGEDIQSISFTNKDITKATVKELIQRGSVLILCKGKGTAVTRAKQLADYLEKLPQSKDLDSVCAYLKAETGMEPLLIDCLKHGVAYHHAGISHEARWLIENLIKKNLVHVVCGTTTLAQGVNFPISSVIVETLKKGYADLTYEDFWNIAGRAGRTLMDSVGIVGFPICNKKKRNEIKQFLENEANFVVSQLASLIDKVDQVGTNFNMEIVSKTENLSTLLQFLAHAMKVSGRTDVADEVEDIMRASLVYHQARKEGEEIANRLLILCRNYLMDLSLKPNVKGILAQADTTGFSTPSVLGLNAVVQNHHPYLKNADYWAPEEIFNLDSPLFTNHISVVGSIPEIRLGHGKRPPFNPARVADILKEWTNGSPIFKIAEKYPISDESDTNKKLTEFSDYLFRLLGIASWGIGALEGLCLSEASEESWNEVGYVPSMVFYGVNRKEAVWMRMVGVPRMLANGLAELWNRGERGEPNSYDEIRNWIDGLSSEDWGNAIPPRTGMTPEHCRHLWEILK